MSNELRNTRLRRFRSAMLCAVAALCAVGTTLAQQAKSDAPPAVAEEKGITSYAEFGGSAGSGEHVLKLDTGLGYNFSQHVGVNFGIPFYFVGGNNTSTTGTSSYSSSGLGAPYAALQLTFKNPTVNYATAVTTFLPAGDTKDGLSTGQTSFDWNNRFEHSFNRVTPFGEIGVGDTVVDSRHFNRPYSSHGSNAHFQGGLNVDVTDKISVGASLYDIAPWGTQTIYSRTLPQKAAAATGGGGNGNAIAGTKAPNNRFFNLNSVTTGTADIAKDHGFSTWVDIDPSPLVETELGFTRSTQFALNTVSFSVRFNLSGIVKKASHQ